MLGYFNRGADPEGLNVWVGAANAGMTLQEMAEFFATSPAATALGSFSRKPMPATATTLCGSITWRESSTPLPEAAMTFSTSTMCGTAGGAPIPSAPST